MGEQYGHLRIDALAGRDSRYRQLVRTTCRAPNCGKVTVKRLDKLIDGTTISCRCVKRDRYLEWLGKKLSHVPPQLKAQIWADAQVMSRPKLRSKHGACLESTLLTRSCGRNSVGA